VLLQVVLRTKYCCSLKVKVFAPWKNFGLATLLLVTRAELKGRGARGNFHWRVSMT